MTRSHSVLSEATGQDRKIINKTGHIALVKPTRCIISFSSLLNITLHVSGGLSVHHQGSKTVHTASGTCHTYSFVDYLLAGTRWNCDVQSWTPDDGRQDRPKHVEWYSINWKKNVHLVGFTTEINHDARSHEHQKPDMFWFLLKSIYSICLLTL
jgi:hypothetical protein